MTNSGWTCYTVVGYWPGMHKALGSSPALWKQSLHAAVLTTEAGVSHARLLLCAAPLPVFLPG